MMYTMGGLLGHTCHVLIHDLTHLVGHSDPTINKIFACIANIAIGVPSAISFGKFHADHHNFLS
jgi:sphingolipid delta-4 desaturase